MIKIRILQVIIITLIIIACCIVFTWAINPDTAPNWTGFGKYNEVTNGPRAKTLWDWLDLLIIPFAVGILGWTLKEAEKAKTIKSENERSQNEILESFIKTITDLIIQNGLSSQIFNLDVSTIARTRINLAFNNLNGSRKGQVLQFLYESRLIDTHAKINIIGANIKNADLDGIVLLNCEIKGCYLNEASLKNANLSNGNFTSCNFTKANLSHSIVNDTNLSYTNLTKAKLKDMDLTSINFEGANLTKANLRGSKITQEQLDGIFLKKGIKTTKSKIL